MKVSFFDSKIDLFVRNLDKTSYAKTMQYIALLERWGNNLRQPQSKFLRAGIFELRVKSKLPVRILYTFYQKNAENSSA